MPEPGGARPADRSQIDIIQIFVSLDFAGM
jgi:hypothetical protein